MGGSLVSLSKERELTWFIADVFKEHIISKRMCREARIRISCDPWYSSVVKISSF